MSITNIKLGIVGQDGNAFNILGLASRALKDNGQSELVDEYMTEAMAGDYDHLLRTTAQYFDVY